MKFDEDKIIQSTINRKQLKSRFSKNSNVYDSFTELEKTAFEDGDLSKKHKELMALSISIVIRCEPCIEWHVQQAYLAGASLKRYSKL